MNNPYIHLRPEWPQLTWDSAALLPALAEARHAQGRLLGQMGTLGFPLRAEANLATLTEDVTKSSAIEGERLDREQVRSSVARRLGMEAAGLVTPDRHVDSGVEMMLDATRTWEAVLTEEQLLGWHGALFPTGRSGLRRIAVGAWRSAASGAMQVVSGPIGREKVHFEAPEAGRLPGEMARFLEWFNFGDGLDPFLRAGLAHFRFVTIHPFEDGNGRIGRAIADRALAAADGMADRFYSMSSQIEAERKQYYLALERSQRGGTDVTAWLAWFIDCLSRAIASARTMLAGTLRKAKVWERLNHTPVNERQRKVLNRLPDGFKGKLSTSKYAKLAKCSEDTALRDIKALVAAGVLMQEEAGGRSTRYSLAAQDAAVS